MSDSRKIGKIPDGWICCPNQSLEIADKFMAFKTPLDKKYNKKITSRKRFNLEMIFSSIPKNKPQLGLWIDLTNTDRYFNKFEIEKMGCTYVKISCQGKRSPTHSQVQQFISVCWEFLRNNSSQIIGVHCTHGYNRTGFMIVSYLIQVYNLDVTQAINIFAAARPPGIYRQYLINDLYKRYSGEAPFRITELPKWLNRRK